MAMPAIDKETIREIRAKPLDQERDKDEILKLETSGSQMLVKFRGKYFKLFTACGENPLKADKLIGEYDHILKVEIVAEDERYRIKVLEILKCPR
jgi:hypothetical protein